MIWSYAPPLSDAPSSTRIPLTQTNTLLVACFFVPTHTTKLYPPHFVDRHLVSIPSP
eukprot:m.2488 g.2488  ORF g.2488 m.2488 type:complete len:57 (+) comp3012_c0_seq1:145-315(+)